MLIKITDGAITGTASISNAQQAALFLANNPEYSNTDFIFDEDIDLYEFSSGSFVLKDGWETIKSEREAAAAQRALVGIKAQKSDQINTIRYQKIYQANIAYLFPGDTEPDGIQMRNEVDRQNIQDLVIDASTNDTEAPMAFMSTSNTLKYMTSAQLVAMGKYLKGRGDQIVGYAWALKAQVTAAQTIDELPDVTSGWPE